MVRRWGAASDDFDAGEEFLHREGLGEVIIRAGAEAGDAVGDAVAGGEEEDAGVVLVAAHLFENLKAVHDGQVHIEHDEVEVVARDGGERSRAV